MKKVQNQLHRERVITPTLVSSSENNTAKKTYMVQKELIRIAGLGVRQPLWGRHKGLTNVIKIIYKREKWASCT